ncbi:TetR/AcrR family transcriptional regulator [Mycolicibacterium austroafricanum]|uniref:TetR/AcrR family transcriptional regulator n=1 Tax=Mycolicibacterium austroafricanum TaxID=39687 RepID=UPI001CA30A00|nr:TetR/AcrR family transcriptional regulator [Mycolicibacterium austroafricanum]
MAKRQSTRNGIATDSETKSVRTRARILDAAAHVLSVKGFAGTRLTDVAEYAEVQAPAIYYYFSSREELIEEVMFAGIGEMRRYLKDVIDGLPHDMSALDKILAAVEAHLRHELELSDYTTASIRNSGQIPEHLQTRQRKEEAAYGRLWRKLFEQALAEGLIDPELDIKTAQLLVMGGLNWAAEWFDPRRFSIDDVVRNAQILVRNGLLSHSSKR